MHLLAIWCDRCDSRYVTKEAYDAHAPDEICLTPEQRKAAGMAERKYRDRAGGGFRYWYLVDQQ